MKKIWTLTLALALTMGLLVGCGGNTASAKTPEELTQLYSDAITNNGGEMVEYNPVISQAQEGDQSQIILESLGLAAEDMEAFGISMSLMNVQAYGIAAIMPAQDKAETVKQALQDYIDRQQQNFEMYLQDQYEVAKNAKLETLEDGTILMVMCQDQDTVFDAISTAIEQG